MALPPPSCPVPVLAWRNGAARCETRPVPQETAVALTYGRATHAVMMATPADLEDFAVGFSLSEGIVETASEIEELEVVSQHAGIELRMAISDGRTDALLKRRRYLTGATGCGLCGMESLEQANRVPPTIRPGSERWQATVLAAIPGELAGKQALNRATHATHAAAFWTEREGIVLLREDVGRHNALDKLAGALARSGLDVRTGVTVLTSRLSVEMVQKAAMMGAPVLMAVSAPTALAVSLADRCGLTLIGVARRDGFEILTHPDRVLTDAF